MDNFDLYKFTGRTTIYEKIFYRKRFWFFKEKKRGLIVKAEAKFKDYTDWIPLNEQNVHEFDLSLKNGSVLLNKNTYYDSELGRIETHYTVLERVFFKRVGESFVLCGAFSDRYVKGSSIPFNIDDKSYNQTIYDKECPLGMRHINYIEVKLKEEMGVTSKVVYFDKGKTYDKTKLEFFPIELMKYFKKATTEKVTGKGKNKKVEIIEDETKLECVKDCSINYTIRGKEE